MAWGKLVLSAAAARGCPAGVRLPSFPRHAPAAAVRHLTSDRCCRPCRADGLRRHHLRGPEAAAAPGAPARAVAIRRDEHRRPISAAMGRRPRRGLDRNRRDTRRPPRAGGRNRPAGVPRRGRRVHRAGGRQPLHGALRHRRRAVDQGDGFLDGHARLLRLPRGWPMIALLALLLAAEAAPSEQPTPKPAPASAVTVAQLPSVPGASQYGAPASLPPVTAQLFHLGGLLEVQPMFSFSVGDPFWRTVGLGVRVEHHFDERWSIAAHTLGSIALLAAPV